MGFSYFETSIICRYEHLRKRIMFSAKVNTLLVFVFTLSYYYRF